MQWDPPLLSLAITLVAGVLGGELVARIKLPKVTGWIATGIAVRALNIPGLLPEDLSRFGSLTSFVLGYIAFTVGAALHIRSLMNAGKRLSLLVITEATITPICVASALVFLGNMQLDAALMLAAVAVAGAPGTTVIVVQEARARGVFVKTLVAAVALIDMVAVGLYALISSMIHGKGGIDLTQIGSGLTSAASEFGIAALIGAGTAMVALLLVRTIVSPAFLGPLSVALILASWGLAETFQVSSILACTFAGIAMTNARHDITRAAEGYLHPFGGVLFATFYTLAGMRLDFAMVIPVIGLVLLFFGSRLFGKSLSAFVAMSAARMTKAVRRYLGVALLPHGGVAVGLILLINKTPELAHLADTVTAVALAALAINQLIGPSATRAALVRAGEAGQDRPRLLDFLTEQNIMVGVTGTSKEEIIGKLVDRLYATSEIDVDKPSYLAEVLRREEESSTCLGDGFMIPHLAVMDSDDVCGVLGISAEGIDLDAPDGRKVHAFVLLATPTASKNRHLKILTAFAKAITRDELREQLYYARSAAHAYQIIHAEEALDFNYFMDDNLAPSRVG